MIVLSPQDEEAVAEANQRRKQVNDDFNEVAGVLRRILLASDLPSPIESIPIKVH